MHTFRIYCLHNPHYAYIKIEEGNINIKLSREEIANVIGTATESAIRLLSDLKKEDIIVIKKYTLWQRIKKSLGF